MNHLDVLTSSFMKFIRGNDRMVFACLYFISELFTKINISFLTKSFHLIFSLYFHYSDKVNEMSEILIRSEAFMQNMKRLAHIQIFISIKIILFEKKKMN